MANNDNNNHNNDNNVNIEVIEASQQSDKLEPAVLQNQTVEYPITLPIKVVGSHQPELTAAVVDICQSFSQAIEEDNLTRRISKKGNYLSLTFNFHAESREQLDRFYRQIESHPMVKWTL